MEKEKILLAVTERFMRLGIKSVSMDDISSELGISKKTLYQTVKNKEELVLQCIQSFLKLERQLLQNISENSHDAIHEMIQIGHHRVLTLRNIKPSFLHDLQKYYRKVWKLIQEFGDHEFGDILIKNINTGINEGLYRPDIKPQIIAKLFGVKSWSIVDETHFSINDFKMDDLIREHLLYHLHGVLSAKGKEHINNYELF